MMDGLDDSPDLLSEEGEKSQRSVSVDLTDNSLVVDISDALSEKEKVKFTVHTRTTMKEFEKSEYSVVRQHEEFVWLHDAYVENENYAGILIPPAPPKPDFEASREKLGKLSEGEGSMTKEEFTRMKQELEAEYLAIFKKTVAMHEIFLCRIAAHPSLRTDSNFKVFLVYENELNVRGKNKKELLSGFFKNITKSADEALILSGQKDTDDFFEHEKSFITEYHSRIKDATGKSDKFTKTHRQCADDCLTIARNLQSLATIEYSIGSSHQSQFDRMLLKVHDTLEKIRKLMSRVSSDEDLKLSDLLRYYMRDTQACKDLLYRRARAMANYETANKELDKARAKGKNVNQAEKNQVETREKFEKLSEVGKQELTEFKGRRVTAFRKNLIELGELEVKHSKAIVQVLKGCLTAIEQS
ncbi:sorting nexin-6-like [Styela clava]|uniref:sorting nexin-6-like isoform X2 n=1 Tax=Styela clava TaxID=7725 RepID=UPI001939B119|nr:sorting nexin-6-like isoform X2 [Styela clava]XP_039247724.1 sorting nexin-6-like isoform X2 [Styela clava]